MILLKLIYLQLYAFHKNVIEKIFKRVFSYKVCISAHIHGLFNHNIHRENIMYMYSFALISGSDFRNGVYLEKYRNIWVYETMINLKMKII